MIFYFGMQGRELGSPALVALAVRTREFIAAAKAGNTRRAYQADWNHFTAWCGGYGLTPLPASPETVALYLTALAATHKPASLRRRLTVIAKAHEAAGYASPANMRQAVVSETLKGIRRSLGTAQTAKQPLLTAEVRAAIEALPATLQGRRDRALLLVGFAGGFRRSELAAVAVEDVAFCEEGLVILVRRSKTDQEGEGRRVALPRGSQPLTCPAGALREWLQAAGIVTGPVFRRIDRHGRIEARALHKDSVGLIVKRAVGRIGLDPAQYAGHSLRAGLATQSYLNGSTELAIMRQTGHRSLATVRRYIRDSSLFGDNAAGKLGL